MRVLNIILLGSLAAASLTRFPAVPLIVHDPFISVWSTSDLLTETLPTFWDGSQVVGMVGMLRVDGVTYRWMGQDTFNGGTTAATQMANPRVTATSTIYTFQAGGVQLDVAFTTPVLGNDVATWMAMPVTYMSANVSCIGDAAANVSLYFEFTSELTVADTSELVQWQRDTPVPLPGVQLMRIGSQAQDVLSSRGDARRISWGFQYLAVPAPQDAGTAVESTIAAWNVSSLAFVAGQPLPADDPRQPRAASDAWPVCASAWHFGSVAPGTSRSVWWMTTYDEIQSIQYYGTNLLPAWTGLAWNGTATRAVNGSVSVTELLQRGLDAYEVLTARAQAFDAALASAALAVGGSDYADMLALAHRQVFGAITYVLAPPGAPACAGDGSTLVWPTVYGAEGLRSGALPQGVWAFLEEMSSDGDVSTVDVLYPASPALMVYSPELAWRISVPVIDYALNCTPTQYNLVWAPHDLGTWPIADKTPEDQEQMPLEESANLLLITASVANITNTTAFLSPAHWAILDQWAAFVNASLPMPPTQLCTDDFLGPAPNSSNLALKGINAMAAYSRLLSAAGRPGAAAYTTWAHSHADFWIENGFEANGSVPHFRRQYNLPGTFSLKYNMLYHEVLDLGVFNSSIMATEFDYYFTEQFYACGVPLDERHTYTLTEYLGALLGVAYTQADPGYLSNFLRALGTFLSITEPRVPMTDWFDAVTGERVAFEARAVVGDLWSLLLVAGMRA